MRRRPARMNSDQIGQEYWKRLRITSTRADADRPPWPRPCACRPHACKRHAEASARRSCPQPAMRATAAVAVERIGLSSPSAPMLPRPGPATAPARRGACPHTLPVSGPPVRDPPGPAQSLAGRPVGRPSARACSDPGPTGAVFRGAPHDTPSTARVTGPARTPYLDPPRPAPGLLRAQHPPAAAGTVRRVRRGRPGFGLWVRPSSRRAPGTASAAGTGRGQGGMAPRGRSVLPALPGASMLAAPLTHLRPCILACRLPHGGAPTFLRLPPRGRCTAPLRAAPRSDAARRREMRHLRPPCGQPPLQHRARPYNVRRTLGLRP